MPTPRARRQKTTRLEALSLERGWSYPRLAEDITARTGKKISAATVHRLAKGAQPGRLTQHTIAEYFMALDADASVEKRA